MNARTRPTGSSSCSLLTPASDSARWPHSGVSRLDLTRRRATIAESVTVVQGKGLVWGTPKSHKRRQVPIPRFLVAELRDHIADKEPNELVFNGVQGGGPLRAPIFRRRFPRRGLGDRHSRIAPAPAAPHRSQPRHRQRRRRQSRAADARPFERRDDDGRLRAPLQRPPRRGRRRARHRPIRGRQIRRCCCQCSKSCCQSVAKRRCGRLGRLQGER